MDSDALFRVAIGQQRGIDTTLTFLSGLKGTAGLIGFERFASALSEAENDRDNAQKEAERLTQVVDTATRKYHSLDNTVPVSPAQREEFLTALTATDDSVPEVIRPKAKATSKPR